VSHWIFVITEYSDYHRGNLDYILKKVDSEKTWPIGMKTNYKLRLNGGDKIVFYVSGQNNLKFIASATLLSGFIKIDKLYGYVNLDEIEIFNEFVYIKKLLKKLTFIKNPKYWGLYLQNGIVKISKKDYSLILSSSK